MFDMLLWFAVVMVLFAVGDVVAKLTKARISSVFATLMLFLILFVAGVLPADIIEKAGLSAASSWSVPMLLFAMGSMINLRQFMDEWRTVVTCWFGMLAVIIGVSLTIPIIGKEMALSAIPVVNGALPATQIMTEAATKAGYPLAAALAAITFAVQKFVGTPFASSASLRYAQGLIGEYRKAKSSGTLDEFMAAAGKSENRNSEAKTASKRITLAEKFDGFYSSNVCILLAVVGGLLSVWLGELTHINYAILGLVLGVIFTQLGVVSKNLLQKAQASGFIIKILSIGCGSALFEKLLADRYDIRIEHGIEPAEGMAAIARKRGFDVEINTAEEADYGENLYDTVLFNGCPCYMQDLGLALRKAHCALREGGKVVVIDVPKESPYGLIYNLALAVGTWDHPLLEGCKPKDPYPIELVKQASWRTTKEKSDIMAANGFGKLEYSQTLTLDPHYSYTTVEDPIEGYDRGSYVAIIGYKE